MQLSSNIMVQAQTKHKCLNSPYGNQCKSKGNKLWEGEAFYDIFSIVFNLICIIEKDQITFTYKILNKLEGYGQDKHVQ